MDSFVSGLVFVSLGVRDYYLWQLVFLCLGVTDSYVLGLGIVTFQG